MKSLNEEAKILSIYDKCSIAKEGSPQRNLHDKFHPLLLKKYKHLLDPYHFQRLKKNEFHSRRGELYIIASIKEFNDNLKIEKFINGGPDFKVTMKNNCVFYLESIVPGNPQIIQNEENLFKSLKSALDKKIYQYKKWIGKGILRKDDIYLISIGLYGYDSIFILHWNKLITHIEELLSDSKMENVSAIVLSKDCDQVAMSLGGQILFNDLRLIHNISANNIFPIQELNVFEEYKERKLIRRNENMYVFFQENDDQIVSRMISREAIYMIASFIS